MESSLIINRRYFFFWEPEYYLKCNLNINDAKNFFKLLQVDLFDFKLEQTKSIKNIRGITAENSLGLNVKSKAKEELLYIKDQEEHNNIITNTELLLSTEFESFQAGDIIHRIHTTKDLYQIEVSDQPLCEIEFRFGFEYFQPHALGIIGLTPYIEDAIRLVYQNNLMQIAIHGYKKRNKRTLPFRNSNLLERLDSNLKKITKIELIADYKSKLNF